MAEVTQQPLPTTDPRYWFREATICQDDGHPGAAAYALARFADEHPELVQPWMIELRAGLMAKQLGYEASA